MEGVVSRVFRSSVRPVELGRKLVREMDLNRTVAVSGATMAPNDFTVVLTDADYEQFADMADSLAGELVDLARQHAETEQYRFAGPIEVSFAIDDRQRVGVAVIEARFKQPPPGTVVAHLVLPGGERVSLANEVISIGRQSDCTVVLGDQNASRRHAEIRPTEDGFELVDLASTNGTKVNGSLVTVHHLRSGDEVSFGTTVIRFEQG